MAGDVRHLDKKVCIVWMLPTALALILAWLVASGAYIILPPDSGIFGISKLLFPIVLLMALASMVALPVYVWMRLVHENFTYAIGKDDIMVREGVLTRKTSVIPYGKIQDITSERTFIERMLGIATIEIETAGSSKSSSEIKLPGISNKDEVISEIMMMVEQAKKESGGKEAEKPGLESMMGEMLKELKAITSKLDAFGASGSQGGEKKEMRREQPGMFEPLGHDDSFKRFRKK